MKAQELSPSGAPIWRHGAPKPGEGYSKGDIRIIKAVGEHIEKHIGPVNVVMHEVLSPDIHVDVYHVAPSPQRDFHTLVTCGMSEKPMQTPDGAEEFRYAELLMSLPARWIPGIDAYKLESEVFPDEEHYWPMRWLKILARYPRQYDTFLCWGHTIPNGDPPQPFASNTEMCCGILLSPSLLPSGAQAIAMGRKRTVHLWAVVPIYPEELDLKLAKGAEQLQELFREHGVTELLDPRRINVVTGKRPGVVM